MPDLSVNRTLVKSPPELWSELSEVESLARHLGEFGEISISRLEPEHTVAWEGEHARGTVELEVSGWGTRVTLSAAVAGPEPQAQPTPQPEPVAEEPGAPVAAAEPPAKRGSWLSRWLFRRRTFPAEPVVAVPAAQEAAPVSHQPLAWYDPDPGDVSTGVETEPEVVEEAPPGPDPERVEAVLQDMLDSLGAAHHRPFSREG
jgi:hypothetical protein